MSADRRFPRGVYGQGEEPDPRFSLADERTFLAYALAATGYRRAHAALHGTGLLDRSGIPLLLATCAVLLVGVLSGVLVLADLVG